MTGRTAARYRVPNRGILQPGAAADLVVFDPTTVAEGATFESPRRLPIGIRHVFVNGVAVVDDGRATGARPGRVLVAAR
jgi:N-acyl-D-amino-acid deacylase